MRKFLILAVVFSSVSSEVTGQETPATQYEMLKEQYEEEGGARLFGKRFLALAEAHPSDPVALDVLVWVIGHVRGKPETKRALELLSEHHLRSDKLGTACKSIAKSRSVLAEQFLRNALAKNPNKPVRAQACYYLASLLDREASIVEQLQADPELAPRILQYYGKDYGQHLSSLEPSELSKLREQTYERLVESFADVPHEDSTLGGFAKKALFALRHLSVGKPAPEIEGEDIHGKPMKLSDYKGKIVMLSFWGHW